MRPLFQINQLDCAYKDNNGNLKTVLKCSDVQIPKGKITMILGKSGAGKSTILETLGLMNKTLTGTSDVCFSPSEKENYQVEHLWNPKAQSQLDVIRKKHFSFIFQQTNLMPNFTAYENICIPLLMQGMDLAQASQKAQKIMDEVDLGDVPKEKKAYHLSGGQRQRLAFARAILPDFSVLFGDEPTGNLDENKSNKLMHLLAGNLKKHQRSAIIVTHNIRLAKEFGDYAIVIDKDDKEACGTIKQGNIFFSEKKAKGQKVWKNAYSQQVCNDIGQTIFQLLL